MGVTPYICELEARQHFLLAQMMSRMRFLTVLGHLWIQAKFYMLGRHAAGHHSVLLKRIAETPRAHDRLRGVSGLVRETGTKLTCVPQHEATQCKKCQRRLAGFTPDRTTGGPLLYFARLRRLRLTTLPPAREGDLRMPL